VAYVTEGGYNQANGNIFKSRFGKSGAHFASGPASPITCFPVAGPPTLYRRGKAFIRFVFLYKREGRRRSELVPGVRTAPARTELSKRCPYLWGQI